MNEKFTPEPWKCHEGIMEPDFVFVGEEEKCDEEERVICEVFSPRKDVRLRNYANLHLIKEAPKMYELLNGLCEIHGTRYCNYPCDECPIRQTLKEARGEE